MLRLGNAMTTVLLVQLGMPGHGTRRRDSAVEDVPLRDCRNVASPAVQHCGGQVTP